MLHVGQRVVCVDDNYRRRGVAVLATETLPTVGSVYTIREIIPCRELYGLDEDGLRLMEILNPPRRLVSSTGIAHELAFRVSRFRPTTNIDVFLRMLGKKPTRAVEDRGNRRIKRPRTVAGPPVLAAGCCRRAKILTSRSETGFSA